MQTNHPIHYAKGADGIVTLNIDCEGQKVNTMNAAFKEALGATLTQLEAEKDSITTSERGWLRSTGSIRSSRDEDVVARICI